MADKDTQTPEKGKLTLEEREELKNTLKRYLAQVAGASGPHSASMVDAISSAMVRMKMT